MPPNARRQPARARQHAQRRAVSWRQPSNGHWHADAGRIHDAHPGPQLCACATQVLLDRPVLDCTQDKCGAVLFPEPGGVLLLCVGLFSPMTLNEAEARADMANLSGLAQFEGRRFVLCEFRSNLKGALL